MEVHEASKLGTQKFIEDLKKQSVVQQKVAEPFTDPIREFARASKIESLVRNWLTYPIEERKRIIKSQFSFIPKGTGDPERGIAGESDRAFNSRQMERWRALCVVIQEESRGDAGNRCPDVAIAALKLLFPEYDWKNPIPNAPK
jgi:hypothetical protein